MISRFERPLAVHAAAEARSRGQSERPDGCDHVIQPGQTWALRLALALLGVGAVGWGGLLGTLAGETAGPAAAGAAVGVTAALDNIGIFIGPPLFGWIVDRTGSYAPAWWTMFGAALLAASLLAFVREPKRLMLRAGARL